MGADLALYPSGSACSFPHRGNLRSDRLATDRRTAWLDASAADVWGIVSNSEALPDWLPGIVSCTLACHQRICEPHRGGLLIEKIVTSDHHLRRLQYHVASRVLVAERLGAIDVIAVSDSGCPVVYRTGALPGELGPLLGDGALNGLAEFLCRRQHDGRREPLRVLRRLGRRLLRVARWLGEARPRDTPSRSSPISALSHVRGNGIKSESVVPGRGDVLTPLRELRQSAHVAEECPALAWRVRSEEVRVG